MSFRNNKEYYSYLVKKEPKKRIVKPFNCDDECIDKFVAAIITSSLEDYCQKIPKITKDMKSYKVSEINKMRYDKSTAEAFFKKSSLFEKTNINFEYLVRQFKKRKEN